MTFVAGSFGGVRLLVSSIETERGRDVVVQSPAAGNKHMLADRGRRQNTSRAELLFIDQPGLKPFGERYLAFLELAEGDEPQIFSHPLDRSYRARIGELTVATASDQRSIRVSCTIHRDDPPQTQFAPSAGVSPLAGADAVAAVAASANAALVAAGIPGDGATREDGLSVQVLANSVDSIDAWTAAADRLDSQAVFLGVATLTEQIDAAVRRYDLASNLGSWPAYQQLILLRYAIVRASQSLTASSAAAFDLFVDRPRPMLSICAEIYGPDEAEAKAAEIARSNRLRTPGLVPAGTVLKMPARSS